LPGTNITFEDVMNQTAITYPIVTRTEMTGAQIKTVLEDLADNRFSQNPYLQQGGDMVRVGGMEYSIDLTANIGARIQDMTLHGEPMLSNKKYIVAGWASRQKELEGAPVWDTVANYLRDKKTISIDHVSLPKLKNMSDNHGTQKAIYKS
jgi:sulfur-oxidizing protein SoxB